MAEWPLSLDKVNEIVVHLIEDGTREGLILGNDLNVAMGASARRRKEREENDPLTCQGILHLPGCEHYGPPTPPAKPLAEKPWVAPR